MHFSIPHTHPALAGHFPGHPIVPGVLILETVLASARQQEEQQIRGVAQAKFTSVLLPDERCLITFSRSSQGPRFSCMVDDRPVASGLLTLASDTP